MKQPLFSEPAEVLGKLGSKPELGQPEHGKISSGNMNPTQGLPSFRTAISEENVHLFF